MDIIGKWLIVIGSVCMASGLIFLLFYKMGIPLGRLPGDLIVSGDKWSFNFPIVTSIIVSILLTIILNVVIYLFRR